MSEIKNTVSESRQKMSIIRKCLNINTMHMLGKVKENIMASIHGTGSLTLAVFDGTEEDEIILNMTSYRDGLDAMEEYVDKLYMPLIEDIKVYERKQGEISTLMESICGLYNSSSLSADEFCSLMEACREKVNRGEPNV